MQLGAKFLTVVYLNNLNLKLITDSVSIKRCSVPGRTWIYESTFSTPNFLKSEYRLSAFQEGWPESGSEVKRGHQPHTPGPVTEGWGGETATTVERVQEPRPRGRTRFWLKKAGTGVS